jgi:Na+-transporting NADH:ubiquinone oxidoreductase subunit NqrF
MYGTSTLINILNCDADRKERQMRRVILAGSGPGILIFMPFPILFMKNTKSGDMVFTGHPTGMSPKRLPKSLEGINEY